MALAAGKRELNKLSNRAAILDAARSLFWERGYDAVTIRDVIRQTELAAGTFYNYFPDKATLLRALIEERMTTLTARLVSERRSARSLENFLKGAYLATFEEISAHPQFYAMLFRNEPVIRAFYSDSVMGTAMRTLKEDLRDAITRGLLPEQDVDFLAAIFFGAGYELARMLTERQDKDAAEAAAFATRLFLHGVQHRVQSGDAALIRRGSLKLDGAAR